MGTLPGPIKDPKVIGPIMKSVWQQYTATAEKYNEPGRFTAMIGYEWTRCRAATTCTATSCSATARTGPTRCSVLGLDSEDPQKLWAWMAEYEQKTGGKLLAIAHNANLSNGRMFELTDFAGQPLTREYAEQRARYDVLQEIVQTKGNSETHPLMSPNDEFAGDLGVAGWEYGNLTLTEGPLTKAMMPTSYLRAGLLRGLEQETRLSVNPSNSASSAAPTCTTRSWRSRRTTTSARCRTRSRARIAGTTSRRIVRGSVEGPARARYTWHYLAAGYAVVWATENTREAIWDAMQRKETYGTSGTRMTVRFFGGWDYTPADLKNRNFAWVGYQKGVPMGGISRRRPPERRPRSWSRP